MSSSVGVFISLFLRFCSTDQTQYAKDQNSKQQPDDLGYGRKHVTDVTLMFDANPLDA
jgi:hypothetical protein